MKEIARVLRTRVADHGHAIEVDLQYSDRSKETLKCSIERAPLLMQGINNAAVLAERTRLAQPKQEISTEIPHEATNVRTASSVDGKTIAVQFQTTIGAPITIAMPLDLARTASERLAAELEKIQTQLPFRPS